MSPKIHQEASRQIETFLDQGIFEICDSQYASPCIVITKGQKRSHKHVAQDQSKLTYRIVTDLRELNSQIVNTTRLVPNIDDLLDKVCQNFENSTTKPTIFTSIDLSQAYYQVQLHKESRHLTAFEWQGNNLAWCVITWVAVSVQEY